MAPTPTSEDTTVAAVEAAPPSASETIAAAATVSVPDETVLAVQTSYRVSAAAASGPSYYVDARAGADSNSGAAGSPWRSLSKLLSVRGAAAVYLHCASTWRESLALSSTHLAPGATIVPYGGCTATRPAILGSDDFSGGWTKSGQVWSRSVPAGTPKINRLFIGGAAHRVAQYPNSGSFGAEFAKSDATSPTSKSTLVVPSAVRSAVGSSSLVGATLRVRSEPYIVEARPVAAWNSTTGQLTLSSNTAYTMEAGDGFVVQDQLWMLDAAGEFYHDTAANRLYVIPSDTGAQSALNNYLVEGSTRDIDLSVKGVSGANVLGLRLAHARQHGLLLDTSTSAKAQSLDASYNGDSGIRIVQSSAPAAGVVGATISGNVLTGNSRFGVDASAAAAVVVDSNTVQDTGTIAYIGDGGTGISVGNGASVTKNRIKRSAYVGLRFTPYGDTMLQQNLISEYCLRMTDCAGIYTWNGASAGTGTIGASGYGATLKSNRVLASKPNTEGAVGAGSDVVAGIFLDDFTTHVLISGNTVHGATLGIHIHNSSHNVVDGNLVLLSTQASLSTGMDIMDGVDHLVDNRFSNNKLVPALAVTGTYPALPTYGRSLAIRFLHKLFGLGSITSGANTFSGNTIVTLNGSSLALATVSDGVSTLVYSPTGWRALNPSEVGSFTPMLFALYSASTQGELVQNNSFESGLSPWSSWFAGGVSAGSMTLQTAASGCSGNCAMVMTGGVNDSVYPTAIGFTAGATYLVRFNATLSNPAAIASPYISRAASPYDSLVAAGGLVSPTQMSGARGETISYEAFFVPTTTANGRLNLKVATAGVGVAFDDVSVRQVTGYTTSQVAQYAAVVNAENTTASTVTCTSLGWDSACQAADMDGNAVALPYTVPAGSSMMFLRSNASWRR